MPGCAAGGPILRPVSVGPVTKVTKFLNPTLHPIYSIRHSAPPLIRVSRPKRGGYLDGSQAWYASCRWGPGVVAHRENGPPRQGVFRLN